MSTINVSSVKDTNGNNNVLINGALIKPGSLDPENKIINGSFDIWQYGTSQILAGYRSASRWTTLSSNLATSTKQMPFALGETLGKNNPKYFLRHTATNQTTTSDYSGVGQKIENVSSYAGQTITVLGWARRYYGSGYLGVEAMQVFGTGGSPALTGISPTKILLSENWEPFAVVMDIPSVINRTIGTADHHMRITFWASAGSDYNERFDNLGNQEIGIDLWGIHIKVGSHTIDACNDYVAPDISLETQKCYRYYYEKTIGASHTYLYSVGIQSFMYWRRQNFPVPMRKTPTVSVTTPTYVNSSDLSAGANDNLSWWERVAASAAGRYDITGYTIKFDAEL